MSEPTAETQHGTKIADSYDEKAECIFGVAPGPTYAGSATSHAKTHLLGITISSSA